MEIGRYASFHRRRNIENVWQIEREVIELVGAINSLRNLKKICIVHNGSCKECPLGDAENVQNTSCPCLTKPNSWTDEKTTEMVKMIN